MYIYIYIYTCQSPHKVALPQNAGKTWRRRHWSRTRTEGLNNNNNNNNNIIIIIIIIIIY
jgi:hypothetical protein